MNRARRYLVTYILPAFALITLLCSTGECCTGDEGDWEYLVTEAGSGYRHVKPDMDINYGM